MLGVVEATLSLWEHISTVCYLIASQGIFQADSLRVLTLLRRVIVIVVHDSLSTTSNEETFFFKTSEAKASEVIENLEKTFRLYHLYIMYVAGSTL